MQKWNWQDTFFLRTLHEPKPGAFHLVPSPWKTTEIPHYLIIVDVVGDQAIVAYGTTSAGSADHGPGYTTVTLKRRTFVNTASSVLYDKRGTRYPGFNVISVKDMKHLVPKDTLTTAPRSGLLTRSDLKRLRKAMGYHDLRQRYFGHDLRKRPERYDTIYMRDEGGQLQAAVVLDCHPDGTYDVSIAVRGELALPFDISYDVANLDTGRSFDPRKNRRVVRLADVVQVVGHLGKGHCEHLEERSDLALASHSRY